MPAAKDATHELQSPPPIRRLSRSLGRFRDACAGPRAPCRHRPRAVGIAITNFADGGRLAVVQGNLIRNLVRGRPAGEDQNNIDAFGTSVEADTAVTGNVLDNIEGTGIRAGYGPYLRDVTITSNVVRNTDRGITISVVPGGGTAVIADNLISEARFGAIVGMEWEKTVTGDLSKNGAGQYAQLSIGGNRVR
jgi:uncharacterized secreted repeat protein (TIGR03808 family)